MSDCAYESVCYRERPDGIVCARTIDASNDVLAAAEGWAHCGHPSKRCRQRAGT